MKILYQSLLNSIKHLNKGLEKKNFLINEPWALVDNDIEVQKYIFKKDGELLLSKNGSVTKGKWEYLPEAKSLMIEQDSGILLLNEMYTDDTVMILKKDGTENSFYPLANSNKLPDLNIHDYLHKVRYEVNDVGSLKLTNGLSILIEDSKRAIEEQFFQHLRGKKFFFNESSSLEEKTAQESYYFIDDQHRVALRVFNGIIQEVYYYAQYTTVNDEDLIILDGRHSYIEENINRKIFLDEKEVPNSKIKYSDVLTLETNPKSRISRVFKQNRYQVKGLGTVEVINRKNSDFSEYKFQKGDQIVSPTDLKDGTYKVEGKTKKITVRDNVITEVSFSLF